MIDSGYLDQEQRSQNYNYRLGLRGPPLAMRFLEQGFKVIGIDKDDKNRRLLNSQKRAM